jgi:hypothetical protein
MKTENSSSLTPEQQAELKALTALPDDQIDTKSIPVYSFGLSNSNSRFVSMPTWSTGSRPARRVARGIRPGSTTHCANMLPNIRGTELAVRAVYQSHQRRLV